MPILQLLRGISAAQFAGIVLLFFLPFVTVSCGNMMTIDITGQNFATGGQPSIQGMSPEEFGKQFNPNATTPTTPGSPGATATPGTPQMPGMNQDKGVDQKISALIAWIIAGAGIALSLIAGKAFRAATAVAGVAGVAMLFWLKSDLDSEIGAQLAEARGMVQFSYDFAFWACVVLFITGAATNAYSLMRPADAATTTP